MPALRAIPAQLEAIQKEMTAIRGQLAMPPSFAPLSFGGAPATSGITNTTFTPAAPISAPVTTMGDGGHPTGFDHGVGTQMMRPLKRPRTEETRQSSDVIYGPVGEPSPGITAQSMAKAAVDLVTPKADHFKDRYNLATSDVKTVQFLPARRDMLSVRFKSIEKARNFISLVGRYPPIPGQVASFREEVSVENESDGALESILRGPARSSR
ncbi:hypothetical protein DFH07DRAFT_220900 [Mycena maculata]|uniref:Uncharacterized protein n=1 Tax=Mycena maculata TaxID=230809 RepID=A0AAD7HUT2_9AGAR|nr:hypothetical protein DFH07DRAFT_220900 [Mycena maculata]